MNGTRGQAFKYLIIGLGSVALDYVIYIALTLITSMSVAKGVGYIAGAFFGFIFNRTLTFKHEGKVFWAAVRFAILYTFTLSLNIAVNAYLVGFLEDVVVKVQVSFLVSTFVSVVLNFLGQKYFVFKGESNY